MPDSWVMASRNTAWIRARRAKIRRIGKRSTSQPTINWANAATVNTRKAYPPIAVALWAKSPSRSSNTLGNANVVLWNTTPPIPVVTSTMAKALTRTFREWPGAAAV